MSRYRYEIDAENAIKVWDKENPNDQGAPFLFQPNWPSGDAWADKAEAQAWVELYIEALSDLSAELVPGVSPDKPVVPRVKPEESNA
jgi:hypothetical protein